MLKNFKLRVKILLILLFISIVTAGLVGLLAFTLGTKTLKEETFNKLTAIREMKANQIENYFQQISDQILSFSESRTVIEATREFNSGFVNLQSDLSYSREDLKSIDTIMSDYYQSQFLEHLINKDQVIDDSLTTISSEHESKLEDFKYWPEHSNHRILQYQYIANNPFPNGEKDEYVASTETSSYNSAHQLYHPIFKNYMDRFGYYDMFLITADSGHIIYSVNKEMDFATDIMHGPFNNTGIASVFSKVMNSQDRDCIYLEDFSPYLPSYNAPASFIASAIYDGENKIGVLVFQLPIDRINQIMTDGYEWEKVGLGKTGETYIVGDDHLMRTQSRFLVEDPDNYIETLKKKNISDEIIGLIKSLNSAIGLQPVKTEGTIAALNGETGMQMFQDYRGVEVLSSFKPLNVSQVNWVIMSELDKSEAFYAVSVMFKKFLFWFLILLMGVLAVSILFAKSISKPVQILTQRASDLAQGNLNQSIEIEQTDEIGLLADHFEAMRRSIKKLVSDLKEINQNLEIKVKKRTSELNRAKEAADSILDKSPVPVAVVDLSSHRFLRVNDAMQDFNLLDSSALLKRSSLDIYFNAERDRPKVIDQLREFGVVEDLELHLKRIGTGEERWGLVSIHPISYFDQEVYITTVIDITERKKMEERLLTQSAAMESAANGIVITSIDGTIQWVNPAFTKLTGYTFDEAIGENPRIIKSGKHDDAYFKNMWDLLLSGKVWHEEIVNKNKKGELYTEEQTITPVFDDKGKITNFVAVKQDITERKRMEAIVLKAKERMEDELNVARDIQRSMLPLIFPAFPKRKEIDLFAELIPAREVGGDFYDFYFLDENHFCFVVGDVSGKGVPGALLMAVTKTLLKSRAGNDKSTASILTHVNNEIARENDAYMFITVFMAILNTSTGELVFSNAGHNPSFILKTGEVIVEKLSKLHGPVVGAMEEMTYTESSMYLNKGDIVMVYTDGITESQNKNEELFSEARFVDLLQKAESRTPKSLIELIISEVKTFEDGAEQADDITALAVQYFQNPDTISSITTSIEIINKVEEMTKVAEQFESFGLKNNIQEPVIYRINIALDELLSNIISYGYKDEIEHKIQVEVELRGERMVIIINDDGVPFNPFKKDPPDTMLSLEEREIGGLGIHIVKNLMDEYNYKRNVDKNIITLVKHNINT